MNSLSVYVGYCRLDQHEDARNRARIDVPDLKFVEVKVPKVIKNNLNSQTASVSNSTSEPKTKVKDLNQERRFDGKYKLVQIVILRFEIHVFRISLISIILSNHRKIQIVNIGYYLIYVIFMKLFALLESNVCLTLMEISYRYLP